MIDEFALRAAKRITDRFVLVGAALTLLSFIAVIVAILFPIDIDVKMKGVSKAVEFAPLAASERDMNSLLLNMAGRPLIRPSQIKAAVKDTGAAAQLLKKLKLQGIVKLGNSFVAYIEVEKHSVVTVRRGEKILEFTVKDIEAQKIVLSLEGVEVSLGH